MILNSKGQEITNPNLETGYLEQEGIPVFISWIIDKPKVIQEVVKATYPNGGKDVAFEVVEPEEGHWEVTDEKGNPVTGYEIPENLQHGTNIPDVWMIQRYKVYTTAELEKKEAERLKLEQETVKAEEREVMLDELPDTLAATDDAICMLYEMVIGE